MPATKDILQYLGVTAAILVASACSSGAGSQRDTTPEETLATAPTEMRQIPVHGRRDLVENSAAVMSASQPGIVFTINDSGNEPLLFALDDTGTDRGAWRLTG
ncbi:MAG: hypothetical protein ABI877_19340, partial [Gemmatimonadaceae bacterium]